MAYLRRLRGLTIVELSERTGLDKANISKIENGKYNVSVDLLDRLAKALGAEIEVVSLPG